jgi:hypothetical protein
VDPLATLASPLALLLLIVTLGYILTCAIWPYQPCPRCHGTAKLSAPFGRTFRICRRCRGTGLRLRLGRRIWNHLRHHHTTQRTERESA